MLKPGWMECGLQPPFDLAARFSGPNEENGGFELFPVELLQSRKIMKEEGITADFERSGGVTVQNEP